MTPTLGFIAYSGTGKTTLLTQLIPALRQHNIRVAVIKHAHHQVDIDKPGKDSYRLRKSGAQQMIISTRQRIAYIKETPAQAMSFEQTIALLDHSVIDLILIEGFKNEAYDKIELHRASLNKPFLFESNQGVCALAHDGLAAPQQARLAQTNLTQLDINNVAQIAQFVIDYLKLKTQPKAQAPRCEI